jgi:hypothetical protein
VYPFSIQSAKDDADTRFTKSPLSFLNFLIYLLTVGI